MAEEALKVNFPEIVDAVKFSRETAGFRPAGGCAIRLLPKLGPKANQVMITKEQSAAVKTASVLDDLRRASAVITEHDDAMLPTAMKTAENKTAFGRLSSLPLGAHEVSLRTLGMKEQTQKTPEMKEVASSKEHVEVPKYDPNAITAYLRDLMNLEARLQEVLEENKTLSRMVVRLQNEIDQLRARK